MRGQSPESGDGDVAGVRYEVDDAKVGWLTIDRPRAGNALTSHSRERMIEVLSTAGSRLEVGCIVNRSLDDHREAAFAREAAAVETNSHTADMREGIAAFVERRTPSFRGW